MKRILLLCNAGMSTSLLVKKMEKAAVQKHLDVAIAAKSLTEAKKDLQGIDVILLGPQIRYELKNVQSIAKNIPVAAIDMQAYGLMNGEKVLQQALHLLGEDNG